jgi:cytolysin-activating lysine-acyltransferase
MWQNAGIPVCFASWAYFNGESEERIVQQGIRRFMTTDWKSGDQLWLIDFLSPFGQAEPMLKELREQTLLGRTMKMLQAAPGGGTSVVEW